MAWWDDALNAVASGASAVGDLVQTVSDAATDAAEKAVNTIAEGAEQVINTATGAISNLIGGGIGGGIISGIGGAVIGLVDGAAAIVNDFIQVCKDELAIIVSVLKLDIPGIIDGLIKLAADVVAFVIDVARFVTGMTILGGIIDSVSKDSLRQFVKNLIETTFSGQREKDIIKRLGLNHGGWGLPFKASHKVFAMDSDTIDLRRMHTNGALDLYAMAGLLSFNSFEVLKPRTYVKILKKNGDTTLFPANRYNISKFLEGDDSIKLQVFAMKRSAYTQHMTVAVEKLNAIGIKLKWEELPNITIQAQENLHFLSKATDYKIDLNPTDALDTFLHQQGIKSQKEGENPIRAVAAFHYIISKVSLKERFGLTAGRTITESASAPCTTAGRSDGCCSVVTRTDVNGNPLGSGVIYRDTFPNNIFKYVLVHEIGHYFGLCHPTHKSFEDIMFTNAGGDFASVGLLKFIYQKDPAFTLEDGKNAWRFIVNQIPNEL